MAVSNFSKYQKIVFVGPMGAGKTTIGKKVAQNLDYDFFDTDKLIEEKTGVSIPLIFELEGESGFRKRETDTLIEIMSKPYFVLATGGGAVLSAQNRKVIKSQDAKIIYLNASLEQLFNRTSRDKNRPLLQTENPKEKLKQILLERQSIYESIADYVIFTDNQSVNQTVNKIIEKLKNL